MSFGGPADVRIVEHLFRSIVRVRGDPASAEFEHEDNAAEIPGRTARSRSGSVAVRGNLVVKVGFLSRDSIDSDSETLGERMRRIKLQTASRLPDISAAVSHVAGTEITIARRSILQMLVLRGK